MLKIRKARTSDLPVLVSLWTELTRHHIELAGKGGPLRPHLVRTTGAGRRFAALAKKIIRSKSGLVHLAEIDGTAVGYSVIFIKKNPPISKINRFGYISDLYVKRECRGLGISTRLKEEAMKWFKQKGLKYASIHVLVENRIPLSIYANWGFFPFIVEMRKKL